MNTCLVGYCIFWLAWIIFLYIMMIWSWFAVNFSMWLLFIVGVLIILMKKDK